MAPIKFRKLIFSKQLHISINEQYKNAQTFVNLIFSFDGGIDGKNSVVSK